MKNQRTINARSMLITIVFLSGFLPATSAASSSDRTPLNIEDLDGPCGAIVSDITAAGGQVKLRGKHETYRTPTHTRCTLNGTSAHKIRFFQASSTPAAVHFPSTRDLYIHSASESCKVLGGELTRAPDGRDRDSGKSLFQFACDAGTHYPFLMSFHTWGSLSTGVAANQYRITVHQAHSPESANQPEFVDISTSMGFEPIKERESRLAAEAQRRADDEAWSAARETRREEERSRLRVMGLRVCTSLFLKDATYTVYGNIDQINPDDKARVRVRVQGTVGLLRPEGFQPSSVWLQIDKLQSCKGP